MFVGYFHVFIAWYINNWSAGPISIGFFVNSMVLSEYKWGDVASTFMVFRDGNEKLLSDGRRKSPVSRGTRVGRATLS